MFCPKCGCTYAEEVILFTSVEVKCWVCDRYGVDKLLVVDATVPSITVTLPSAIKSVPIIVTIPEDIGRSDINVEVALPYKYTIHYDWVEK